jgi:hypothetical protein
MADVTSTFNSLSSTESSNNPAGSASIGAGLDDNLRMLQALTAAWRDQTAWGTLTLTSVAGTNTITATLATSGSVTFGPTALSTGMKFILVPANTNTGATTLNITSPNGGSALGAKNVFCAGSACIGGELKQSQPALVEYDGTQFNIIGPLDINALTADASPSNSADYVQTYDASASGHKKVLLNKLFTKPTVQTFTSSSGTYTTPTGVTYIKVRMVGGGGGGGSNTANGTDGGDTTFSTLTAGGGSKGSSSSSGSGGAGGTASGSPDISLTGGAGGSGLGGAIAAATGGMGGISVFGGAGAFGPGASGAPTGGAGKAAQSNTGSGGGGAGGNNTYSGAGGG